MAKKFSTLLLYIILTNILSACVPALVLGGAGAVGYTASQERSIGEAVDDAAIETQVIKDLYNSNKDLYSKVKVDSVEGRVLLTGTVPSRQARLDAYKIAWQPRLVKEVINEININSNKEFSAAQMAKDGWISTQIESKMLIDKNISSTNYSVETLDGVVYFMGIAKSQAELDSVTNIARQVSGVQKVVSHVRLKDSPLRNAIPPQKVPTPYIQ